jgi:hypothetical protein
VRISRQAQDPPSPGEGKRRSAPELKRKPPFRSSPHPRREQHLTREGAHPLGRAQRDCRPILTALEALFSALVRCPDIGIPTLR